MELNEIEIKEKEKLQRAIAQDLWLADLFDLNEGWLIANMKRYIELLEQSQINCEDTLDEKCRLSSDKRLWIAPQEEGEPPPWVPTQRYDEVKWVDRKIFDELIKRRHERPCEICPIADGCEEREVN